MEEEERRRIGQALADAREQAGGLTQTQLAHQLGYADGRSVRYWEAGERQGGFWRNLDRICEITGKSREWFVGPPQSDAVLNDLLRQVAEIKDYLFGRDDPPPEDPKGKE